VHNRLPIVSVFLLLAATQAASVAAQGTRAPDGRSELIVPGAWSTTQTPPDAGEDSALGELLVPTEWSTPIPRCESVLAPYGLCTPEPELLIPSDWGTRGAPVTRAAALR
jgi:hypothetical protein